MNTPDPVSSKWSIWKVRMDVARDKLILWVNGITVTLAGVDYSGVLSSLPQIQQYIPINFYAKALGIVAILNFISHNFLKHRS